MPTRKQTAETRAGQIDQLFEAGAEALAEAMKVIKTAWRNRDDQELGFPSWEAYATERATHLRKLDQALREGVEAELEEIGMSQGAIAATVGVTQQTVSKDQKRASHNPVVTDTQTVTGLDGREQKRGRTKGKPDEIKRRVAEVARLWEAGYNRNDIAGALGIANGTVDSDLRDAGIERGKRPTDKLKPRGAKIKTKPWRNKEDPDNVVVYLKSVDPQCVLDEKRVDQVIHEVDQALTDLENYDALTGAQVDKIVEILSRTIDAVLAREAERKRS